MLSTPVVKDLVLLGGGHSHLPVLRQFGMRPVPGIRLTLVSRGSQSPYSGMLPGLVAGHYSAADMHFDLRALADFAGARFIQADVTGIDTGNRRVLLADRPPLEYDWLSINVGSTPSLADLAAAPSLAHAHLTPVKPIDRFHARWLETERRVLDGTGACRIGVVGGGAGGVELVLAVQHRLRSRLLAAGRDPARLSFHLVTATAEILPTHHARTRRALARVLAARGVQVLTGKRVVAADAAGVTAADGTHIPLDEILWVTSAAAAPWLREAGLAVDAAGYVRVGADLRSVSHPEIFAAGDCAAVDGAPRPKSGVFAVRQGPVLADNLRRACHGAPLRRYKAQRDALAILATGPRHAIASRGSACIGGDWVWRWKDFIDRRFMRRFQQLPTMAAPATPPAPPTPLLTEFAALGPLGMRCGGCGAKVGAEILGAALRTLPRHARDDVLIGLDGPDDAAVTRIPVGQLAVHTIDGFRAFTQDPWLFGEITAAHCLSDIFAMGATPQTALAYVTLPLAATAPARRDLASLLAGASAVFAREDTALVGGHTAEGAELALAFAVNGTIAPDATVAKDSVRAGDVLILTKPLGTGVVLAGAMRRLARPAWVDAALDSMRRTNGPAARAARAGPLHAMTDVTGFGLAGHLGEMLRRGGLRATLDLAALPLLDGAEALAADGVRSTLHQGNARLDPAIVTSEDDPARRALLFDPQTSGGLLLAVPAEEAAACLARLAAAGCEKAARVGRISAVT